MRINSLTPLAGTQSAIQVPVMVSRPSNMATNGASTSVRMVRVEVQLMVHYNSNLRREELWAMADAALKASDVRGQGLEKARLTRPCRQENTEWTGALWLTFVRPQSSDPSLIQLDGLSEEIGTVVNGFQRTFNEHGGTVQEIRSIRLRRTVTVTER